MNLTLHKLLTIAMLILPFLISAQAHLSGRVAISMKKSTLESKFTISQYETEEARLTFALNDIMEVSQITMNDTPIEFEISEEDCADCILYTIIPTEPIKPTDAIQIVTSGVFQNYEEGSNTTDYKGRIANNYDILRASEQSKWYPTIVANKNKLAWMAQFEYSYAISATCEDCKSIFIGRGAPQSKKGTFRNEKPQQAIMLIAGDYDWTKTEQGIHINMKPDQVLQMDSLITSVRKYYGAITGIEMSSEFVFAHLPSDNKHWGGFVSYPAIIDVNKKSSNSRRTAFISHELAHFYFGDLYRPKSNLHWFYLESFAEYFSNKYLLSLDTNALKKDLKNLKRLDLAQYIPFVNSIKGYHFRFIKLEKVKAIQDISVVHRYAIGGFQLLGVEHEIGEAKMQLFIKKLFQNINDTEHGYVTFINTLKEIGIDEKQIKMIEKKYFKKLRMKSYEFLKAKI